MPRGKSDARCDPQTARAILWEHGIISPWYLRPSQLEAYSLLSAVDGPFLEASRRWGKTTTILAYCLEQLRLNPGWVVRWCEPFKNEAREIVQPEIDKIQASCPDSLKFRFQATDSVYIGPGNSRLYLRGVNEDRARSARGAFAHIVVADEFGFWNCPEAIESVFLPQLLTTRGKLITASTPPEDLGHVYYLKKEAAIRRQAFLQKTIYDNESLTPEDIASECEKQGGAQSPTWRREYLCEPISNPERLVIPEYDEKQHDIDESHVRPPYYDAYVSGDLGFHDNTALLFGYYDFLTATLIIEDEFVAAGKNSREITDAAKVIEKRLWGTRPPFMRVSDNELQQLHDMHTLCGYSMVPTRKDDKFAAINGLRLRFRQGKIKIHKRCKALRFQLKVGLWNEQRTNYLRGQATGHLDAIDALVYLNRNLNVTRNPYPPEALDAHDYFVQPVVSRGTPEEQELARALFPFRK